MSRKEQFNVTVEAETHVAAIVKLDALSLIEWQAAYTPRPGAIAYHGVSPDYTLIIICESNIENAGVVVEGTAVSVNTLLVLRLPPELAQRLYQRATAQRN